MDPNTPDNRIEQTQPSDADALACSPSELREASAQATARVRSALARLRGLLTANGEQAPEQKLDGAQRDEDQLWDFHHNPHADERSN